MIERQKRDGDQRLPVLVVTHSDGYIEVFGDDRVDAKVMQMPHADGPDEELAAEDWVTQSLPPRHRDIYFPGLIRAMGNVERVTLSELAGRRAMIGLLRAIDTLTADNMEVTVWTCSN